MARPRDVNKLQSYALLRELKASLGMDWVRRRGAHAMGIGRKIVNGKKTNTLALRVYVAEKRRLATLRADELVPSEVRFLSRKGARESTLPTDVIETPPARSEAIDPETRIRPVPGGVSGGINGSTGTIGGWVWDTTDDTIVLLSNDHVLETVGADILQQGTADGGSLPADKIGDVKRTVPRTTSGTNVVDCAIGDVDSSSLHDLTVVDIGPAVHATAVATLDLEVEKYGQSTRHTFGEITDADWNGMVDSTWSFDDCFRVDVISPSTDWSNSGDSGSLVFSQTPIASGSSIKPVVGLHFAGASTYGVGCKIQNVFEELDLTTLCAGAFAALLDALFDAESEGEVGEEAETRLRGAARAAATRRAPLTFAGGERSVALRFSTGLSRDVETRLATTREGRLLTDFVDAHRAELLTLLTQDGDLRRATVAALGPLLAGATTTTDFFERTFTAGDLRRIDALAREVQRAGSSQVRKAVKPVFALRPSAEGKTVADVVGIRP
jgi:hypothetical protein